MSRIGNRLRRLERRRRPAQVMYITVFSDADGIVTDDGRRMTVAEWEWLHPDARHIQLTWGDDADNLPLSHVIPADVWDNL